MLSVLNSPKTFIFCGAVLGGLAVAAGAFGAHALKQKLDDHLLTVFEIGVRYQMFHALALIALGLIASTYSHWLINASAWLTLLGTIIFSGSLYILTLTGIRAWGAVTPVGGLILLLGWLSLAIGILKTHS